MFENLFSRKPHLTPQEFASTLLSKLFDETTRRCYHALSLSESEMNRYLFSTHICMSNLPFTIHKMTERADQEEFLSTAFAIMLSACKKKTEFVRLGDYVITEYERMCLVDILERRFQQHVLIENIKNHEILFGILMAAVAMVRGKHQSNDFKEVYAVSPPEKHREHLAWRFGRRLESYIYEDVCLERSDRDMSRTATFARLADHYCFEAFAAYRLL